MIWKGYPFVSIMMLAGLQSIPEDFYHAARVDGANAWQRLINITLPSLMPVLGVTLVLVMLWVFRDFSIIYVLTGGGPLEGDADPVDHDLRTGLRVLQDGLRLRHRRRHPRHLRHRQPPDDGAGAGHDLRLP